MFFYRGSKVRDAAERCLPRGPYLDSYSSIDRLTPTGQVAISENEIPSSFSLGQWDSVTRMTISEDKENTRLIQFSGFDA